MEDQYDIAVVGGGIAGFSVAAELASDAHVVVLEAEDQPGYHATGRSAAILAQNYGNDLVRALTAWSEIGFRNTEEDVLTPRGLVRIASEPQVATLRALFREMADDCALIWLDASDVEERVPLLRRGWVTCGFANDEAADMDVAAIMSRHAKRLVAYGGRVLAGYRVQELLRVHGGWVVASEGGRRISARILVDAAGAWADDLAGRAGAIFADLEPRRRSAVALQAPAGTDLTAMPMVVDADECFYLKPDGGGLMASPCDETPSAPCDSRPEEIDVAICIDRIERAFDLEIRRPRSVWSGLRTFSPDGNPVCGWDPEVPGFYWLAGQGGYGVQTAPALARIASDDLLGRTGAARTEMERVDRDRLSPGRFHREHIIARPRQGERT